MKDNNWLCEVQAPPELHESIEQFFNALSHADGWQAGYEYGYEKAMSEMRGEKDGDVIYRRQAIHAFDNAGFCTHDYVVGTLKDLPPAQPERKKGKWIVNVEKENTISGSCSACGWQAHLYEDDVVGMKFCPNCGCRMEGESDE